MLRYFVTCTQIDLQLFFLHTRCLCDGSNVCSGIFPLLSGSSVLGFFCATSLSKFPNQQSTRCCNDKLNCSALVVGESIKAMEGGSPWTYESMYGTLKDIKLTHPQRGRHDKISQAVQELSRNLRADVSCVNRSSVSTRRRAEAGAQEICPSNKIYECKRSLSTSKANTSTSRGYLSVSGGFWVRALQNLNSKSKSCSQTLRPHS